MRPDDPSLGPSTVTVACVNFESVPRDKAATLDKIDARVAEAAAGGSDLVVFPELALNSWGECPDCAADHAPCAWHRSQAEAADGPSCRAIVDMAAAHGIADIVAEADLREDYIIPSVFNRDVAPAVAAAVAAEAKAEGAATAEFEIGYASGESAAPPGA